MNSKLRKIINHYGLMKQLKYFQSEIFELNEAIIKIKNRSNLEIITANFLKVVSNIEDKYKEHIKEEIADVMVMLKQFQLYYDISTEDIKAIMKNKVDRQLERIEYEPKHGKEE